MPSLIRLTKVNDHEHLVFLKDDGTGLCSVADDGHTHSVTQPDPEAPFEQKEDVPVRPPIIGTYNGHTHEMLPDGVLLEKPWKEPNEAENDIVAECLYLYRAAYNGENDAREFAEEALKFYEGDQWKEADRQALENENRACLTLNEIEGKIDLLSGYQRQNRTDIKFLPVEGGDQKVSDLLNILVKNICDQTGYEYEETQAFDEMAIVGRSFFHVYVDYDKNIEGDIVIEKYPWDSVYLGPHDKPDASDAEYMIKSKWFSQAKILQMYPSLKDKISAEYGHYLAEGEMDHKTQYGGDEYAEGEGERSEVAIDYGKPDPDLIDMARKEYRVIEVWRKHLERVPMIFSSDEDFVFNARGHEGVLKLAKNIPGFKTMHRKVDRIRKTVLASKNVAEDTWPDLVPEFMVIPVYGKKRGTSWWGKVKSAIDPQKEINKRQSQLTDILSRVSSYGWFYDDQTFGNQENERLAKNRISTPGFMLKVSNAANPPTKVEGVRYPSEMHQAMEYSSVKLREIMNINPELLGLNTKAESGVAIAEKKRQGLMGNEFLFDNLDRSKKRLGRLLVALIQKVYTPERVSRVVMNKAAQNPSATIGGQPAAEFTQMDIAELFNNADLTKYDVAVSEAAYSPTQRRANFTIWSEMAGNGVPVPYDLLVDLSDLGEKDKVKAAMAAQAQAATQAEDKKLKVELYKTLLGKGVPPQVVEQIWNALAGNQQGGPA